MSIAIRNQHSIACRPESGSTERFTVLTSDCSLGRKIQDQEYISRAPGAIVLAKTLNVERLRRNIILLNAVLPLSYAKFTFPNGANPHQPTMHSNPPTSSFGNGSCGRYVLSTEANLHRRIFRESNIATTPQEVRIDRSASTVGAHQNAKRMRSNDQAHGNSYKFESRSASRQWAPFPHIVPTAATNQCETYGDSG
jgi:hypothetical protein